MNNEPIAFVTGLNKFDPVMADTVLKVGTPLYTHPAKENTNSYMVEVLNNTLNMERNHNEKAYKELYALCEKLAKENEALKAKTLTDEEIIDIACKSAIATTQIEKDFGNASIEFARAILRKAQEK